MDKGYRGSRARLWLFRTVTARLQRRQTFDEVGGEVYSVPRCAGHAQSSVWRKASQSTSPRSSRSAPPSRGSSGRSWSSESESKCAACSRLLGLDHASSIEGGGTLVSRTGLAAAERRPLLMEEGGSTLSSDGSGAGGRSARGLAK